MTNHPEKEPSMEFYTPVKPNPDSNTLNRQRFRQTAYSLLSATLMGSSLGLVIYQRRTISLLQSFSSINHGADSSTPSYPIGYSPTTETVATTANASTTTFDKLSVFLLSCWFPVAVWFTTLMSTSFVISSRNYIPRCFSPRTGILASHLVFTVVWVILASVQEVHEKLFTSSSSSASSPHQGEEVWTTDSSQLNNVMDREHISTLQPDHNQKYPTMLQGQRQALGDSNLSSMAVSLCVVWYVAVILLGAATALLATSSTILDSIMDLRLKALVHQNEDEKSESKDARNAAVDTTTRIQFPMAQKLTLVLLILVLFYSQMWFFEWIHSALNSLSPSGVAVSTRLSVFGLLSSTLMITLGVRIIPVVTDAPDLQ